MKTLTIPASDKVEYSRLGEECRRDLQVMLRTMSRLLHNGTKGIGEAIRTEAGKLGISASRLRAIYDEFRATVDFKNRTCDWRKLINRSKYPDSDDSKLPREFIEQVW